ncbi:DUF4272 domain-containing protein [Deinococcus sp. UYEF24]
MSVLINAYSTFRSPPTPEFPHLPLGIRNLSDPELAVHLEGFVGYVLNTGQGQMTAALYHVMRHIQRVQTQFSLEVDGADLARVAAWAEQANALCFWPDGTVRDPQGRVLVNPDGSGPNAQAEVPYPPDALERKSRSEETLRQLGVWVPASLPPVPGEQEAQWRSSNEVAARATALFAAAVMAETRGSGDPLPIGDLEARLPGYKVALTPQEQAFLDEPVSSPEQIAKFSWRYESLSLLQWSLGLSARLPWPTDICDVPEVARLALDMAAGQGAPKLRNPAELLDALDLTFRLHWAVRDARLKEREAPAGLEGGVVFERHHALNWLTRFENDPWDEVDTPT